MLELDIDEIELFDDATGTFKNIKGGKLQFEHSLISLSKWESEYRVPFLTDDERTDKQTRDYIKFMCLTRNVDERLFEYLPAKAINALTEYIKDPMTATTFVERRKASIDNDVITSEIIYYWMVSMNIPFECQKWHLNRLITLIRVISLKNEPEKKMTTAEIRERNAQLNEERKRKYNTKG